jgi:hypothetical protein
MSLTHFERHWQYHDAIDRLEAKERAMREEAEQLEMVRRVDDPSGIPHGSRKAVAPSGAPPT